MRVTFGKAATVGAAVAALGTGIAPQAFAQLIAQDSYYIGTGGYANATSLNSQSTAATVDSYGFTGYYNHGAGTSNFLSDNTYLGGGLTYTPEGVDGSMTGLVHWNTAGAPDNHTYRSVARNLSTTPAYSSTIYMGYLMQAGPVATDTANSTTTSGSSPFSAYVLTGFGGVNVPDTGTISGTDAATGRNNSISGLQVGFAYDTATSSSDLVFDYRNSTSTTVLQQLLVPSVATSTSSSPTYAVVFEVDIPSTPSVGVDTVNYWVDPTNFASDATLTATSLVSGSVSGNIFTVSGSTTKTLSDLTRLNYQTYNYDGDAFFDEPTIGTSLANTFPNAVTTSTSGTSPEPGSVTLFGMGALTFAGLLKRRRRS